MNVTCPRCGGSDARRITPTYFECVSLVDASIPPGVAGNASFVGGARSCGHRFHAGHAVATPPCGVAGCGRDSIGTCQGGCGRRLCGDHGSPTGTFVCADCRHAAELRHDREVAEQQAAQRAAAERTAAAARAALAAADGPAELRRLLVAWDEALTLADAKAGWLRLMEAGALEAQHELVTMVGRSTLFGRRGRGAWSESPQGRLDVWHAPRAGCVHRPYSDGIAEHSEEGLDVWLDANGDLWLQSRMPVQLSMETVSTDRFALPKGAPVAMQRSSDSTGLLKFHRVENAVGLSRHKPDDIGFRRAVATIVAAAS